MNKSQIQSEQEAIRALLRSLNDRYQVLNDMLKALELAEDPEFIAETALLEARLNSRENMGEGLTAFDLAKKYL